MSRRFHRPISYCGRMHLDCLREHRSGLYTRLILFDKLYKHLAKSMKPAGKGWIARSRR
ncbi:MAG: TnpV protein [Clostridia bacterium]|nr:TnpV protein [Clostridia bacterium]